MMPVAKRPNWGELLLGKQGLSTAVQRLAEDLRADGCRLYAWRDEQADFMLLAAFGRAERWVHRFSVPVQEGLLGYAAHRTEPVAASMPSGAHPFVPLPGRFALSAQHYLVVPISHQGELIAMLVLERMQGEAFQDRDKAACMTVAAQWSSPLQSLLSREEVWTQRSTYHIHANTQYLGVAASAGISIGQAVVVHRMDLASIPDRRIHDVANELRRFKEALQLAQDDVAQMAAGMLDHLPDEELGILKAYQQILQSESFIHEVTQHIRDGQWAPGALRQVVARHVRLFDAMEDAYLRERGSDIRDLGQRILQHLMAVNKQRVDYPMRTVLVAEELTATMLLSVPASKLAGIVAMRGSANAHVAIMARSLGIPAVLGVQSCPLSEMDGVDIIVDGYFGQVILSPSAKTQNEFARYMDEEAKIDAKVATLRDLSAQTLDGDSIDLMVNTGMASDLGRALQSGAQGVGLYRTEIPFMSRDRFPAEEEQHRLYRHVLRSFMPKPVTMRTLDVGGDKPLPYFSREEANPFLGWRGIRVVLDHPEIFLMQCRAMLRANHGVGNLRVLLPMITHVSECESAAALFDQAYEELKSTLPDLVKPPLGVMLEVPSSIYQIHALAKYIDFFSVGSNDLMQYFFAVDRNNHEVAHLYDGLSPAILRFLQQAVSWAHVEGKSIALCGELASDPLVAVLLLAMGFDQLSMASTLLPKVKWVVRSVTMKQAKAVLHDVLGMDDPVEVRSHLEHFFDEVGLGALLRAGR